MCIYSVTDNAEGGNKTALRLARPCPGLLSGYLTSNPKKPHGRVKGISNGAVGQLRLSATRSIIAQSSLAVALETGESGGLQGFRGHDERCQHERPIA